MLLFLQPITQIAFGVCISEDVDVKPFTFIMFHFPQNINVDDIPTGSFSLVEIIKLLNVTRFDVKSINLVKVKNDIKKV